MKNYYDKVLFVLALLLLGLGVAYFFLKGGLPSGAAPALTQLPPAGGAYTPVPTTNITSETVEWDETPDQYPVDGKADWDAAVMKELNLTDPTKIPLERQYPASDLWYYGVFTPPKIWWDPAAGWTAESPKAPKPPPPPFAMHLEGLENRLYRIQFQGYIGSATNPLLQMADTENNTFFNTKVGQDNPEEAVKVTSFKEQLLQQSDGTLHRVGIITIVDERANQTLTLTSGVPLTLPNDQYFLLETDDPLPSQRWEVTKVGETLDVGNATFKITGLDLKAPSATVEKDQPNEDTLTQTLTPTPTTTSAPAPDSTTPPATPDSTGSAPAAPTGSM
ncbi:MAG: hypothetical protein ABSH19_07150 [Opitutales bacterium]